MKNVFTDIPGITAGLIVLLIAPGALHADVVRLKNGRIVEGVITERGGDVIVMDVGFGTVSINEGDIEHLTDSSDEDDGDLRMRWRKDAEDKAADQGHRVPVYNLSEQLRDLKRLRLSAITLKERRAGLHKECAHLDSELSRLYRGYEADLKSLRKIGSKSLKGRNDLVEVLNKTTASIESAEKDAALYEERLKEADNSYASAVKQYRAMLFALRAACEAYAGDRSDADAAFYEEIRGELDQLVKDLRVHEMPYRKLGDQPVVEVIFGNRVRASMIFSGRSGRTLISADIAASLGLGTVPQARSTQCFLDDGRAVPGLPVLLDRVRLGVFTRYNVRGAVADGASSPGIDGVLGRSFLSQFDIEDDREREILVVREFFPQPIPGTSPAQFRERVD